MILDFSVYYFMCCPMIPVCWQTIPRVKGEGKYSEIGEGDQLLENQRVFWAFWAPRVRKHQRRMKGQVLFTSLPSQKLWLPLPSVCPNNQGPYNLNGSLNYLCTEICTWVTPLEADSRAQSCFQKKGATCNTWMSIHDTPTSGSAGSDWTAFLTHRNSVRRYIFIVLRHWFSQ